MVFRLTCVLAVVAVFEGPARPDEPASSALDGVWGGRCRIDKNDALVYIRLKVQTSGTTALVESPKLGVQRLAAEVQASGEHVELSFPIARDTVRLRCRLRDGVLVGTTAGDGWTGDCALRRRHDLDAAAFAAFRGNYQMSSDRVLYVGGYESVPYRFLTDGDRRCVLMAVGPREFLVDDLRTLRFERDDHGGAVAAIVAEAGQPDVRAPRVRLYTEEPVTFASGEVRLAGTLRVPMTAGPHPAVVFVHGSGPGPREHSARDADRFARSGIASLAFDKRGSGASTGDWRQADFDVLVEDILAAVHHLRGDPRIRADKVGLFGISQAGWIIPLAATRSADVAFIVPVSGAAVMPAEQELWRQRQNLEFLGVPERYIALERQAAAMVYDWQRRHQLGSMPLPDPFTDDALNMFHDAPGVLRAVRQPVLAIFGGKDTLTPTHESAALWANALREGGNTDYSVRLFPNGTHGLEEAGRTGSPLEMLVEPRWVASYFDTVVRWIHHHAGGPAFAAARQVDADPDAVPLQARGMHELSWFGSGAVQPWQLLGSLLVFASAVLTLPAAWLWRRIHRRPVDASARPRTVAWLAAIVGLVNVGVLLTLVYVLQQLVQARPHPVLARLDLIWNLLAAATWVSLALTAWMAYALVVAWRDRRGPRNARIYYSVVLVTALCWVPFAFYWDLVRPAW
jgi:dienelactone hydrolase